MAGLRLVYKTQVPVCVVLCDRFLRETQELPLANERIRIGRAPGSTVQLSDALVSGNHAVISNGFLYDAGSTNGSELNGVKVCRMCKMCRLFYLSVQLARNVKAQLKAGDVVRVGDVQLKIGTVRCVVLLMRVWQSRQRQWPVQTRATSAEANSFRQRLQRHQHTPIWTANTPRRRSLRQLLLLKPRQRSEKMALTAWPN